MELLEAVNIILPILGEHPVTSVNTKHPTLAIILPKIDLKRREVLMMGLWFNKYRTTLYPDSEGYVAIPTTTISFLPTSVNAVVRAGRLMNTDDHSYTWTNAVLGDITEDLPFEELPETAASAVMYGALVAAYVTDIGLESNVQVWQSEERAAIIRLNTEHLRNKKYSTRKTRQYHNYRRALRA